MKEIDPRDFRDGLGTFATGVTVITTFSPEGHAVGITVNSFTSVSLDPPLILWCLGNDAESYRSFEACSRFSVHILHQGQQDVSGIFSIRGNNKFANVDWDSSDFGTPRLADFTTCLHCAVETTYAGGDHLIILGRVLRIDRGQNSEPLVYHEGSYRRLA